MLHIMKHDAMFTELKNHKCTSKYSELDILYFTKKMLEPENYDTIICYLDQDKSNTVLYTKRMLTYLAQLDGVEYEDTSIFNDMTIAIVDIFSDHIIDSSTFINIATEDDVADALLRMRTVSPIESKPVNEIHILETHNNVCEESIELQIDVPPIIEDTIVAERKATIKRQLNLYRKNKKISSKYITRAAEKYDDIEARILKGLPNKRIYKQFGSDFGNKKHMDAIILSIKQIITNCDDISDSEQEEPGTISEQIANHMNSFTMERNIVAPISDISYAVKQHFMTSSINNMNVLESYTSTIDNSFIRTYVNQPLRNMRDKYVANTR